MLTSSALDDLRVVEIGDFVAGPFAARLLADAGAEVIKIEPLAGDSSRRRGPFPKGIPDPEQSGLYHYLNANKLGIALDLGCAEGKALLRSLVRRADVLLIDAPTAEIDRLGLRFSRLRTANPKLIVTALTPFGLTGPRRLELGSDLISVSAGGLAYASPGVPDMPRDPYEEPPLRANTQVGDYIAGLQAVSATLAAVEQKAKTHRGCEVDISRQEAVAMLMVWEIAHASYLAPKKRNPEISGSQPNAYLPCKDGFVVVAAFLEHHWRGLVRAMGNPDWAATQVFATAAERARNWDALEPLITEWTMSLNGQEIATVAQQHGVPCFPALTIGQMVESAHVNERGYLRSEPLAGGGKMLLPGYPVRMSQSPWAMRWSAPRLGEHTDQVMKEKLGRSNQDIARLRRLGVVR